MSAITLTIVVLFLIGSIVLGLAASWGRQFISDDYFLASRSLPWYAIALGMAGASFGLLYLPGMVAASARLGVAPAGLAWTNVLAYSVLLWIFLPFFYRKKTYTTAEFIERRYSRSARGVFSVLVLIYMLVGVLMPALYAGGWLLSEIGFRHPIDGLDGLLFLAVALVAAATAAYTVYGGLSASVWSSVLQMALLLIVGITLAILATRDLGGVGEVLRQNQDAGLTRADLFLPANNPLLPWTGMLAFAVTLGLWHAAASPVTVQRCLGARSEWDAKMGVVVGGFLQLLLPLVLVVPGLVAKLTLQEGSDAGGGQFLVRLLDAQAAGETWRGAMVQGLALAALLAGVMSTISAVISAIASVWTIDVCQDLRQQNASEVEMIGRGRRSSLVAVILAALLAPLLALWPRSVLEFVFEVAALIAPAATVVFLMAFFWPRGHGRAAAITMVFGVLVGAALWFVADASLDPPAWIVPVLNRAGMTWLVSLVVFALGTVLIPQNAYELYDPDTTWNLYWSRLPLDEREMGAGPRSLLFWWIVLVLGMLGLWIAFR